MSGRRRTDILGAELMKRPQPTPLAGDAFESDEVYLAYRRQQLNNYELRLVCRIIAVVAALATLSLFYQYFSHARDSLYLIYALMAAVLAVWCWWLHFDDVVPDFGSRGPSRPQVSWQRRLGGHALHLLIVEGFLESLRVYHRDSTAGSVLLVLWACYIVWLAAWYRVLPARRRAREAARVARLQFPRL